MSNVSTISKQLHNETRNIHDKYLKAKETLFRLRYKVVISNKICLLCSVGIEAVFYDCYESACVMPLLWWLQYIWCCVFYDLTAMSTAFINSTIETSMEWSFLCGVTSFANVWKHRQCYNDIGLLSDLGLARTSGFLPQRWNGCSSCSNETFGFKCSI